MVVKKNVKKEMTVADLARITGRSFESLESGLEKRFDHIDEQFLEIRNEMTGFVKKSDLRETEGRLLLVLNRIESKLPDFEVVKHDIADLSDRVGILEKRR